MFCLKSKNNKTVSTENRGQQFFVNKASLHKVFTNILRSMRRHCVAVRDA